MISNGLNSLRINCGIIVQLGRWTFVLALLALASSCTTTSNLPADGEQTLSSSYEVSATYQLEIKDEQGRIIHRTGTSKVVAVEHDNRVIFSESALMEDFLETANLGLDSTVSNVVTQLKALPVAPSNPPPAETEPVVAEADPEAAAADPEVAAAEPKAETPQATALDAKAPIVAQAAPNNKADKPSKPEKPAPPPEVAKQAEVKPEPEPLAPTTQRPSNENEITDGFYVKKVAGETLTASKNANAKVGGRYFVRSAPEAIIDPFTNQEKLISKGTVNGVAEIESIGLFGVKARLLSGNAAKGNYLEPVQP